MRTEAGATPWPAVFEQANNPSGSDPGFASCTQTPSSQIDYYYDLSVDEQTTGSAFGYSTNVTESGYWEPMATAAGPFTESTACNWDANAWYGDYYYGNWGKYVASVQWSNASTLPTGCVPAFTSVDGYPELSGTTPGPNCCSGEELWNQNSTCYTAAGGSCTHPWTCISYDCAHGFCDAGVVTAGCVSNSDCISPAKCWPPTGICLLPSYNACTSNSQCVSGVCAGGLACGPYDGDCFSNSDCNSGLTCDNGGSLSLPGPYTTWTCI